MEERCTSPWRGYLLWMLVSLIVSVNGQSWEDDSPAWSEWSEWSECSRSCGLGVSYRERTCLRTADDGSSSCVGPVRHYNTCNTQDCPRGYHDFRLGQCEHYNNISFDGEYYDWVPHYGGVNRCELNCLAKGETFYYRHAAKVMDGTPCGLNTRDICIDGVCQEVGCDLALGSKLTLDKCGECGGDGTSCKTYGGYLDTDHLKSGYNDLILIPAGAMSISFKETLPSNNYIAIRDLAGGFILNGDWQIEASHELAAVGTTFTYTRGVHPADKAELLTASGPTSHPLFFSVLRQPGAGHQVAYEYSLPLSVQGGASHTYAWIPMPWTACSASCGEGEQTRTLNCQRSSDEQVVDKNLCDPHRAKPSTVQPCNTKPCPASWHIGLWERCSTTCGEGVRARSVFCQRRQKDDLFSLVLDGDCLGPKPTAIRVCNEKVTCPKWQVGKWSECNRVCGLGQQTRTVYCLAQHPLEHTASDILPSARCDVTDQPISARECNEGPCDGLEWVTSAWSGCLGECGRMMETRRVVCSSKVGEVFNDTMCDVTKRPGTSRACPSDADCAGQTQWHASQWSQCSALCGPGVQTRSLFCVIVENGSFKKIHEERCDLSLRMRQSQNCTGENCWGIWFNGPWGKCSAECGSGKMKREVLCFYGDQVATASDCDEGTRPVGEEPCNVQSCEDENTVGGCKNTEFGCCPDGETPAEGVEYFGCQAKDRIPTGSCVETEYGCCLDGITPAQGPFNAGCPYFTCKDMVYGCCPDGQTPAAGPTSEGCPEQFGCTVTAYGCCPDGITASNGFNNEGCESPAKMCAGSRYGCCPDGVTEAAGAEHAGCDGFESSGEVCEETAFGCCLDGISAATGPHQEGCNEITSSCGFSLYGCCPDGATAAEGPNSLGCPGVIVPPVFVACSSTTHGCCPDGETTALGADGYGCSKIEIDCASTRFGCCEDGTTIALGANDEGCPVACLSSEFGCCPDGTTAATGTNEEGCHRRPLLGGCRGTRHGCCPDNTSYASGPYYQGCNVTKLVTECDMTTHGCCLDGETVAAGPDLMGCPEEGTYQRTCRDSHYGCCPDGTSPADGPDYTGCPSLVDRGASCGLNSETGTCSNFTVKWYFDPLMGDCTRFWYGGCEGNDNRFDNREDCQATCVKPEGIMSCYLPKSVGRCRASQKAFHYNPENRECEEFVYGGCLGNGNRFETHKGCEDKCITPQSPDVCSQPHMPGPCHGNFERWFHDKTTGHCRQFIYGGCMGNDNRFETTELCEQRCQQSATKVCQLPMDPGPCRGAFHKFYFDAETRQCREFIYGGCHGNSNRFTSLPECQSFCNELVRKVVDVCLLPKDPGPCKAYMQRWYLDGADGYCKQFVYGGCDGNGNRFDTEELCRTTCNANVPVDVCGLDVDSGPCEAYSEQYAYDRLSGTCVKFVYGGCEGNANRFMTIDECKKTCPDAKDQEGPTVSPATTTDVCQMEKDAGPCYAYQTRFFYDPLEAECMSFTYGGCQGNENNFGTLEECQSQCRSTDTSHEHAATQSADICSQTLDGGPCYDWESRYFYNMSSATCEHFFYGGCEGNGNNFASQDECRYYCAKHTTTTTAATTTTETQAEPEPERPFVSDICQLHKDAGPCYAHVTKYHYDSQQGACVEFVYGGCLGNHNNFENREECEAYCVHTEPKERPPTATDVCTQPRDPGPCYGSLTRYHYDPTDGRCLEFVYGGCQGNDNNFGTLEECTGRCGGRAPTTSITGDRCDELKDSGVCLAYMPRYYYDLASGTCRQFIYGGCQGNRNRFMSEEDCREACVVRGSGVTMTTMETARVEPTQAVTTPENTGDICQLPQDEGECRGYQPSWYYDAQRAACQAFIWGGCGGNANRFQTMEDCTARCTTKPTKKTQEPTNEPVVGLAVCGLRNDAGPCRESVSRFYYDYEDGMCKQFIYGGCRGNENNFDSREDCQRACPVIDLCLLPSETGLCRAAKRRYFYNHHAAECQLFTYGGCGGNANRFLSQENCESVCASQEGPVEGPWGPGEETDVCTLGMDAGPCAAYQQFWFYSGAENTCREFTYGGCLGNGNRFVTAEECTQHCQRDIVEEPVHTTPRHDHTLRTNPAQTHPPHTTKHSHVVISPSTARPQSYFAEGDVCGMNKDPGSCTDYAPVWYYELNSQTCRRFLYGGCDGNGNRFDSRLSCESNCLYADGTTPIIATTTPVSWHPHSTLGTGTAETTVEYDLCALESDAGPCRDNITVQWYYNTGAQECQRFLYGGCEGNANRFTGQKDCEKICILRQKKDACEKPADKGPCEGTHPSWYFDVPTQRCQQFVYGGCQGNGNRFQSERECGQVCGVRVSAEMLPTSTTTTALMTNASDTRQYQATTHTDQTNAKDVCMLAAEQGPCSAGVRKWYYDYHQARCLEFTYGGCLGNGNQFDSEEQCRVECGGTIAATPPPNETLDQCTQPAHPGPCFADYLRYFFDQQTGECRPFIFGGCQANDNNFESQEDCYGQCGDPATQHTIRKPGDCYLAPDAGPCHVDEPRYHFDPAIGDCVAFYYGGCEGNGNNFGHYEDCIAMCSKATVSCGVLSCDLECPGEYARGPDGCLQCRCKDPCEGHRCEDGFTCEVQQVQCFAAPCPEQAVCVPRAKDGECPQLDVLRMGSCDSPCERDADCVGTEKCCSSSCGNQCTAPTGPAALLPQCPPIDGALATTPVQLCAQDVDCPHGGRCCINSGMGQVCVPAEQIPGGCTTSPYGCCPDGVTDAQGYNFHGCPEEQPDIHDTSEVDRIVTLGGSIVFNCMATGSPKPQITWYKDGFPVLADDTGRYAELEDDSLQIRKVDNTDNAIFTCRAYNGVGSSATKAYTLTVSEPVTFGEMQSLVTVEFGSTVVLDCMAHGKPEPRISWLRGGSELFLDGLRITHTSNNSLVIQNATTMDGGDYICEASNDVGTAKQRIIVLNVQAAKPVDLGPLSIIMSAHNTSYNIGHDVSLLCIVTGQGDVRTSWMKDGVAVVLDDRVTMTAEGELVVEDVVEGDAGTYRCTATRGQQSVHVETQIQIARLSLPENCGDKPWLANCVLIVQARLCRHVYFSDFCCQSCHEAGQLP